MNYAEVHNGPANEVALAIEGEEQPDITTLSLAIANALRRIHVLELRVATLRDALQGVLDPFHQGQISVRAEAAGSVQAAIDAGEEALIADRAASRTDAPR